MGIRIGNRVGTYDCFECAIHDLDPGCGRCGQNVIGHGVESDGRIFCGANCAREAGSRDFHA